MKTGWIEQSVAGLLALVVLATAARADTLRPQTRAVLIGIGVYDDARIQPRPRAEADARALHDLIRDERYFGVPAENVRLLVGADATRAKFLAAIDWLVNESGPDDMALFFYFGQCAGLNRTGSQTCFLTKDSAIQDRAGTAVACAAVQERLKKLSCRRFGALMDVRLNGYTMPANEDESNGADLVRCFLGDDDASDRLPGRFTAWASAGLRPVPSLNGHGLFAHALLAGLKGAADADGAEADGVVTVGELNTYLEREIPALAAKFGQTRPEQEQVPIFVANPDTKFVLTRNPAAPKVRDRFDRFAQMLKDGAVPEARAEEGRKLLSQMPKLRDDRDLRGLYQGLADGALTLTDFEEKRAKNLDGRKLDRKTAETFKLNVLTAADMVKANFIKPQTVPELVGRSLRGMYRGLDEPIPDEIDRRLKALTPASKTDEVRNLLTDVRTRLGKREDLDGTKDTDLAVSGMCTKLDRHTDYLDPEQVRRFQADITSRFTGVGVQIRRDRVADALQVVSPIWGGPAHKAGLRAGNLILTITRAVDSDGKALDPPEVLSTKGMTTEEAVKKVMGTAGTKVTLSVRREGEEKPSDVELTRATIQVETVMGARRKADDSWDFWADPDRKFGYIRVTQFSATTDADVRQALLDLRKGGLKGLVLDLRFNPGGLLASAVKVADLFTDDGVIVSIKTRKDGADYTYVGQNADSYLDFPVACLVNGSSASASEVVSACLQDHGRAVVVGERSFGKGSMQTLYDYPATGGKLKLTTATFWRPSGKNLNKASTKGTDEEEWGVRPNPWFEKTLSRAEKSKLQDHLRQSEIIRPNGKLATDKPSAFRDEQLELALRHLRQKSP